MLSLLDGVVGFFYKTGLSNSIHRILMTIILISLCTLTATAYVGTELERVIGEDRDRLVVEIRNSEWLFISSVINENYDKAETQGKIIKSKLEQRLNADYSDQARLKEDLDSRDPDAKVYAIFTEEIRGVYLNGIRNDNNDPFIASEKGILSDTSLNCAITGNAVRSWDTEISLHANKSLAAQARDAIVNQRTKKIFWQYLPSYYETTDVMDIDEVRNEFLTNGVTVLAAYEFLKPVYIHEREDIFGTKDVSNVGAKQPNYKLIVVSGFNILDILTTKNTSEIAYYQNQINYAETMYQERIRLLKIAFGLLYGFFAVAIGCTLVIHKHVVMLVEDSEDKSRGEGGLGKKQ